MSLVTISKCYELDGITPKQNCFIVTDVNGNSIYVDGATVMTILGLDKKVDVKGIGPQIKAAFNSTNYFTVAVGIPGRVLFTAFGSNPRFDFANPVRLPGYTVATLPAGTTGMTAYVTDATTPTFMGVVVGGGAVVAKVFFNGVNWITQ